MINSFTVTDLGDATSYAYSGRDNYNLWISAVDPTDKRKIVRMKELFAKKNIKHFYQFFYDWSDEDYDPYIQRNLEEYGPSQAHVNNIISFLEPFVSDDKIHNLGVNCFAGVSRSTAIAIIAMVMSGMTPEEAIKQTETIRPFMNPNLRILRFASTRLGKNLVTPVKTWKNVEEGIYLPKGLNWAV